MKKLLILLVPILFLLTACESNLINEYNGFKVYGPDFNCEENPVTLAQDDEYFYYLYCDNESEYKVIGEDGTEYQLSDLFSYDVLSKEDVLILLDGVVFKGDIGYTYDYDDERLTHVTNEADLYTMGDDEFYVYSYLPTCPHCSDIKPYVLKYLIEEDYTVSFYLADRSNYFFDGTSVLGDTVPALYHFIDGEVVDEYHGTTEILNFLDDFNQNSTE